MRLLRNFLTLSLSFSILCLSFANSYSEEIFWNDYREPLSNVKVIHDESATIYVDIPENFVANKEEITLVVTVKSNVYVGEALKREKGFHLFYPSITVNDKLFGSYRIYVKELPEVQTHQINIKTKRLKSGKNKFKAKYNWNKQGNYCVGRCSYTIKEISFRDSPPLLYNLTVSSIPAEADIYLDEKYYGKTPRKLEVGKGWHNIKIEKAGYQISLDDIKVFEDDEYFIELERKIKSEKVASLSKPDSSISADYQKIIGHWWMEGESMVIEEIDNRLSIRMDRLRGYHRGPSGQAKYRETTHSNNISWDGKHLEFEIWMPSGAGGYEVFYSLTLSDPNTLLGTKQASGSSLKIEVEFKER
jgi:hypothetical protein